MRRLVSFVTIVAVPVGLVSSCITISELVRDDTGSTSTTRPAPSPRTTADPNVDVKFGIAPAQANENLILVAAFEDVVNDAVQIEIRRRLQEDGADSAIDNLRVEAVPRVLDPLGDERFVERLAEFHNATVVIWGANVETRWVVNFWSKPELDTGLEAYTVDQRKSETLSATTLTIPPDPFEKFVVDEIPARMSFLSLFAFAHVELTDGNIQRAIELLQAAIATNETPRVDTALSAQAHSRLSSLYITEEEIELALDAATTALELSSDLGAEPWHSVGYAQSALEKPEEALQAYDTALTFGDDPRVSLNRAGVLSTLGEIQAALDEYERLVNVSDIADVAYYNRSILRLELGESEAALSDLDDSIGSNPEFWRALYQRGRLRQDRGDHPAAIEDFTRAIAVSDLSSPPFVHRGKSYMEGTPSRPTLALADFVEAAKIEPTAPQVWIGQAAAHHALGNVDAALTVLDQGIREVVGESRLEVMKGKVELFLADGNVEEANRVLADIEVESRVYAFYVSATIHLQLDEFDAAISDLTVMVEEGGGSLSDEEMVDILVLRGNLYNQTTGLCDPAVSDWGDALDIDPFQIGTRINRSICSYFGSDAERLASDIDAVEQQLSSLPELHLLKGLLASLEGDPDYRDHLESYVALTRGGEDHSYRELAMSILDAGSE